MALTENTGSGDDKGASRDRVKRVTVLNFDPTASEKLLALIRVDGLGKKTIIYDNRSGAQNHTLKVYVSIRNTPPAALGETHFKLINTTTVNLGTTSNPIALHNEYYWLQLTITGGAIETNKGDLYFIGTNNG